MDLSPYQSQIIDAVLHGNGNIMIQAFAGAGKTSTLIEIMRRLPSLTSKLYCAFNTDIVHEITVKTQDIQNLSISTIHSLGYSIIQKNIKHSIILDENKYRFKLNNEIESLSDCYSDLQYNQRSKFLANIRQLINYSRNNLSDGERRIGEIATKYGINILGDEIKVCIKMLEWGREHIDTIDFTDMVWLPNVLPFRCPFYDFILVDECQDLSIAQQKLVLKCHNIKTRYIFCGDEKQAIYSFSGSDSESFQNLAKTPNTNIYFLPICYRCADLIVVQAMQIVPQIKHNSNGVKGEIFHEGTIEGLQNGDMVICRNNAPLAKLYIDLLKNNIPCHIKGKEIETQLIEMVNNTNQEKLNIDLENEGVFAYLYNDLVNLKYQIQTYEKCTEKMAIQMPQFKHKLDLIETLKALSDDCNTASELVSKIKNTFSDETQNGISLSTIHKAKGLESDNVHILSWSLFATNTKHMTKEWEINQEKNLQYVALTRAKKTLHFIENDRYSNAMTNMTSEEMAMIEYKLSKIFGNQNKHFEMTMDYAKEVVKNFKPFEKINEPNIKHGLDFSKPSISTIDLKSLFNKKHKK